MVTSNKQRNINLGVRLNSLGWSSRCRTDDGQFFGSEPVLNWENQKRKIPSVLWIIYCTCILLPIVIYCVYIYIYIYAYITYVRCHVSSLVLSPFPLRQTDPFGSGQGKIKAEDESMKRGEVCFRSRSRLLHPSHEVPWIWIWYGLCIIHSISFWVLLIILKTS